MSVGRRLLLLFSLLLFFSFLMIVSNTEAARIKVKKTETIRHSKDSPDHKKPPVVKASAGHSNQRSPQLEEEYLVSELDPEGNTLIQKAFALLGIKYRFGGNSYAGIDCSAFVKKVFAALHLPLPRTAREQYAVGNEVPAKQLQKGDLLFYHTYAGFPSHVGIYLGDNLMIHASSAGGKVMISKIDTPYFLSRFIGARRISSDGGGGFLRELSGSEELETTT